MEMIEMEEKCRKLTQLLREHKNPEEPPRPEVINDNEIDVLQREIESLEIQKKQDEIKYK